MIVEFDKSFSKSLDKLTDTKILARIEKVILKLEQFETLDQVSNSKKLIGFSTYYRIKIGDYRLGFEKINEKKVRIIVVLHRKDIYKKFP